MGYTTDFDGHFELSRQLTETERDYIQKFNDTRHMRRDVEKLHEVYNGKYGNPFAKTREEVYGREGEYFIGADTQDGTVLDINDSPGTPAKMDNWVAYWQLRQDRIKTGEAMPGLWCQWTVDINGTRLEWDGGEKFYNYTEWLTYLITNFFDKWGVKLNGIVYWEGENSEDKGKLIIDDSVLTVKKARIVYD
jgi:hypothetical protein